VDYASAYVYAVSDKQTYDEDGLEKGKSFIVVDELLSMWQFDAETMQPSVVLQGMAL
jgi:hypothetical protein